MYKYDGFLMGGCCVPGVRTVLLSWWKVEKTQGTTEGDTDRVPSCDFREMAKGDEKEKYEAVQHRDETFLLCYE